MPDIWLLFCVCALFGVFFASAVGALIDYLEHRKALNHQSWWRHVTGLCLLLAAASVAGANGWQDVTATADDAAVKRCIYIKQVRATEYGSDATTEPIRYATAAAVRQLMIQADRANADVVLVTEIKADDGRAAVRGEAWRCEAR